MPTSDTPASRTRVTKVCLSNASVFSNSQIPRRSASARQFFIIRLLAGFEYAAGQNGISGAFQRDARSGAFETNQRELQRTE